MAARLASPYLTSLLCHAVLGVTQGKVRYIALTSLAFGLQTRCPAVLCVLLGRGPV